MDKCEQALIEERFAIQLRLTYHNKHDADTEGHLPIVCLQGKWRQPFLVFNQDTGGTLSPDQLAGEGEDRVIDILKKKHPAAQSLVQLAITGTSQKSNFYPVTLDEIYGPLIRSVALKMQGSAGQSGVDAASSKCTCTSYQSESDQLCDAINKLAFCVSTTYVDPEGLTSFVACRLIVLDKLPRVRPNGVVKYCAKLLSKTILSIIWKDIQTAVGSHQLRHEACCKVAVHALWTVFEDQESGAMLLVVASNAFNSLNRSIVLRNVMSAH